MFYVQLGESSAENGVGTTWEAAAHNLPYNRQPVQSEEFFEALQCNNSLQIG